MVGALLKELCPALADIVSGDGWETIKEEQSDSFDNAMVELECSEFAARIIRDRGRTSIDLTPMGTRKWTDLETVLAFIGETVPSRDPDTLSRLLAKNFGKVGALMTSNTDQLEVFEKQRSSEFIKGIFPSRKV